MEQVMEKPKHNRKTREKTTRRFEYQGEMYRVGGSITPSVIKEIVEIQKTKGLTPQNVVERAKNRYNPLHTLFEWNDTEAGKKYRLFQANGIINQIEIEIKGDLFPRYENVTIVNGNGKLKREYYDNNQIISNNNLRQQMLQSALLHLEGWKMKYEYYNELKPIVVSIDTTKKKLERKWNKTNKNEKEVKN